MFDKVLHHAVLGGAVALLLAAAPAHARRGAPAELDIRNGRPDPVAVYVDGVFVERLDPGEPLELRLRPGRHEVRVTDRHGQTIEAFTTELAPHAEHIVRLAPPVGELRLDSGASLPLSVTVRGEGAQRDQRQQLDLAPGRRRSLDLAPGRYTVTVQAEWFGQVVTVSEQRVVVEAGERDRLRLHDPREALVQVRNPAPVDAELVLLVGHDPRPLGPVPASSTATVLAPVGTARLGLMVNGVLLDQEQVRVDARHGGRYTAQVAVGELELENHGREPLVVYVDGVRAGPLRPGDDLELTVLAGPRAVRVVDGGGRIVLDEQVWIDVGGERELELGRRHGKGRHHDDEHRRHSRHDHHRGGHRH